MNALWSLEVYQPGATNGAQIAHSFDPEDMPGLVGCARRMLAKDGTRPVRVEVWRADINGNEGMDAAINWMGETGDQSDAFVAGIVQDGMPAELMSALFDVPMAMLEKVCAPTDFREDGIQAGTIYRPTKHGRKVHAIAPRLPIAGKETASRHDCAWQSYCGVVGFRRGLNNVPPFASMRKTSKIHYQK